MHLRAYLHYHYIIHRITHNTIVTYSKEDMHLNISGWTFQNPCHHKQYADIINRHSKSLSHLVELLLKLLIGVIDAELLEAVGLERLEAVDIQHPDEPVHLLAGLEALVDAGDDVGEYLGVNVLRQRVSR